MEYVYLIMSCYAGGSSHYVEAIHKTKEVADHELKRLRRDPENDHSRFFIIQRKIEA